MKHLIIETWKGDVNDLFYDHIENFRGLNTLKEIWIYSQYK